MNPSSENRKMLLTGVSGNIGKFVVQEFATKGWTIVGIDRIAFADKKVSENIHFFSCNLSDFNETEKLFQELNSTFGAFDVIINCAGMIANSLVVGIKDKELKCHDAKLWNDVITSNLYSTFNVSSLSIKQMMQERKKGVVINFSSISANGNRGQAAYSAAKAGINAFTLATAKEVGTQGIRVVAIAPGFFDTATTHEHVAPEILEKYIAAIPLKKLGHLNDIIKTIQYIIDTEYINGKVIELDGGLVI